ncbi:hypothetical protein ATPR_0037 [Acetobacter tropicalis NBRC 101654]|uniref:Uncharacterized protein n=1 Tax=Acetobacter tropicalis NBRC 101654 TaxID=749388 RepID=F7V9I8_9PROT|nr:hypothetical protein ATPR_0037 [Acetobacter tropicalis NBRC 101654]
MVNGAGGSVNTVPPPAPNRRAIAAFFTVAEERKIWSHRVLTCPQSNEDLNAAGRMTNL